jgi:prepilin-type N-terminal cleavage/methylation domain-containing protein
MVINQQTVCKKQAGFTLVELAIVMIIIGLLIGGVLKGQELIGNAQVTSTIAQMKAIDAATTTFRDIYSATPGDLPAARLPNCAGFCANGDLDGVIEAVNTAAGSVPADPGAAVPALAATNEITGFFGHLVAANLINGANVVPTALAAGNAVPDVPITSASLRVGQVPVGAAPGAVPTGNQGGALVTWRSGKYITVAGAPGQVVGPAGLSGLTPTQSLRIDNKLDDGNPILGIVRAGGAAGCVVGVAPATVYNTANVGQDCASFVQING